MQVLINVSLGELIDKITILEIKNLKIEDTTKKEHVQKELETLRGTLAAKELKAIEPIMQQLQKINLSLWEIEDKIRLKEKKQEFDDEFIQLARSVYKTNDQRFLMKNKINQNYDSAFVEVKSYEDYE